LDIINKSSGSIMMNESMRRKKKRRFVVNKYVEENILYGK